MTTEFENLISSISIEELSKIGDKERVVSEIKKFIAECYKNSELEKVFNLGEEQTPQRKILKNFTIKRITKKFLMVKNVKL